jgi:hypothetical protein
MSDQSGASSSRRATRASTRQQQGLKAFAGFKSVKASSSGNKRSPPSKAIDLTEEPRASSNSNKKSKFSRQDSLGGLAGTTEAASDKEDVGLDKVNVTVPETAGKLPHSIFATVMYASSQVCPVPVLLKREIVSHSPSAIARVNRLVM